MECARCGEYTWAGCRGRARPDQPSDVPVPPELTEERNVVRRLGAQMAPSTARTPLPTGARCPHACTPTWPAHASSPSRPGQRPVRRGGARAYGWLVRVAAPTAHWPQRVSVLIRCGPAGRTFVVDFLAPQGWVGEYSTCARATSGSTAATRRWPTHPCRLGGGAPAFLRSVDVAPGRSRRTHRRSAASGFGSAHTRCRPVPRRTGGHRPAGGGRRRRRAGPDLVVASLRRALATIPATGRPRSRGARARPASSANEPVAAADVQHVRAGLGIHSRSRDDHAARTWDRSGRGRARCRTWLRRRSSSRPTLEVGGTDHPAAGTDIGSLTSSVRLVRGR